MISLDMKLSPHSLLALILGLAAAPVSALAAAPPGGDAAVVRALGACREQRDDAQRLACYDRAAGAFEDARAKGDVVVVDREQVRAVRRQAFGFRLPTLDVFPRGRAEAPLTQIATTLTAVGRNGAGKWVMTDADGATWVQTDSEELGRAPHDGSRFAVRAGSLGSFFCKVDGQPQIRCDRSR